MFYKNSTFIEAIKTTWTKKKYLFITIAVYCQIVHFKFQLFFFPNAQIDANQRKENYVEKKEIEIHIHKYRHKQQYIIEK